MKRLRTILALLGIGVVAAYAGWRLRRWREAEEEKRLRQIHTLTGVVKEFPKFRSSALGLERRVWVYLPPQYAIELERRFPVLYMHDGQNVFDGATAFLAGKEWEADETAERLIEEGRIEPLIIVAVDNGGERRTDEYTPTRNEKGEGGKVDVYGRMLVEELKPWIDETFRTRPDRESTAVAGSSLGGVASLWIGLTYPERFGKIASLSTSVWWDDGAILRFIESLPARPQALIWTDMGTEEGARRALAGGRRLRDILAARGWREGVDLMYLEDEGAPHNETAWAKRLPAVLEFLFPAPSIPHMGANG